MDGGSTGSSSANNSLPRPTKEGEGMYDHSNVLYVCFDWSVCIVCVCLCVCSCVLSYVDFYSSSFGIELLSNSHVLYIGYYLILL